MTDPTAKKVATNEAAYWDSFYDHKFTVAVPSQFCCLVAIEAPKTRPFVEFGCGNGRDSNYMASQGLNVFSGDLSSKAIENLQESAAPNATFSVCDVSNPDHVKSLVEQARAGAQESDNFNLTLYNRFFMHALDEAQELKYLEALSNATKKGDTLYMEYRCSLDAPLEKEHGKGHYRRYIETKKLVELLESLDFSIKYEITGQGMAKYKAEDPFVSRIICERN
ncbi:hypothetical protein ACHAWT_005042 [Skeletonema menzelii]|mmetsp:Transcript_17230/g.28180  ORF Transcript_17230/g.28180 Transcript_17230/m.28180 type:complete len:223 (-) Transcript_17230:8-676(-)